MESAAGYIVKVKRIASGEVRELAADGDFEQGPRFGWSEGNYSCDCNRHLAFIGWPQGGDTDAFPCGQDAYAVRVVDAFTGAELWREDRWRD